MSGYRTVHAADAVVTRPDYLLGSGTYSQRHRVEIVAWNAEAPSLVSISSGYDKEVTMFQVEDLDLFIALLEQTKASLEAGASESGATAAPNTAAPVTTTTKETA